MAFKTFAPGVLTSSDVNTFLMRQAVITCTSSTRPASPSEGMTIYETDTDTLLTYTGAAWSHVLDVGGPETFTPTILSEGTGTDWAAGNAVIDAVRMRVGQVWIVHIHIEWGSTSVFGSKLLVIGNMPEARRQQPIDEPIVGMTDCFDVSLPQSATGRFTINTSNKAQPSIMEVSGSSVFNDGIKDTQPFTWQSGDQLTMFAIYEAD